MSVNVRALDESAYVAIVRMLDRDVGHSSESWAARRLKSSSSLRKASTIAGSNWVPEPSTMMAVA